MAATELLEQLLVDVPGTSVGPGRAWSLAVSDRDRLLAAIYVQTFSDQVESEVPCQACEARAEINFSLQGLVASLEAGEDERRRVGVRAGPDEDGVFTLDDGLRFRLPTSADQRALFAEPAERAAGLLLRRCVLAPAGATAADLDAPSLERVAAAMAVVGPTVEHTFEVACDDCGAGQTVHFDIQQYLLRALEHERRYLIREVHYLACAYGWSLGEILDLSRADRRAYVELVAAERAARRKQG